MMPKRPAMPVLLKPGEKPTAEQVQALLGSAVQWAAHLNALMNHAFPDLKDVPALNLEGLTFEEKMALGEKAAADLLQLAYNINPHVTLDGMENDLPEHTSSQDEADRLVAKLRRAPTAD